MANLKINVLNQEKETHTKSTKKSISHSHFTKIAESLKETLNQEKERKKHLRSHMIMTVDPDFSDGKKHKTQTDDEMRTKLP